MAIVYLAQDLRHNRPVALKVVGPEAASASAVDRFLKEIEVAARLQHPHILAVFDSGAVGEGADRVPYFVMPYVEGETLRARLQREPRLPVSEAVRIADEVAGALAYAHAHGVVHRDIKLENILLSGGHAVVADFGVAKALRAGATSSGAGTVPRLTMAGLTVGTPHFMSPEQATAEDKVDARADQYSLGCVLYEMLAGAPPFDGATAQSVIAKSLTAPRPRPGRGREGIPASLDAVTRRAMALDPAERYPDMAAFGEALRGGVGTPAMSPRRRVGLIAAAVLAIGVAVFAGTRFTAPASNPAVASGAETIAVLPFNASGPGTEVLGEGMVDLLSTNLEGVGGIRTVDPRAALKRWSGSGGNASGLDRALKVGRELHAASVVVGSAVSTGSHVRLAADLYSVAGERLAKAQVDGPSDSVLAMVDRLSLALLGDVWRSREPLPSVRIASLTTDSIEALRAYLQGEQYYRRLVYALGSNYRRENATSDTILNIWAVAAKQLSGIPSQFGRSIEARTLFNHAFSLVGLGRLNESLRYVDSVARISPSAEGSLLALPIALGIAPRDWGKSRLDSLLKTLPPGRMGAFYATEHALMEGQTAEAWRLASAGLAMPDSSPSASEYKGMLIAAGGWGSLLEGDTTIGIQQLRAGIDTASGPQAGDETSFLRFQLALALSARAETRAEGIRWLRYAFDYQAPQIIPLTYLALGRAYEAAGTRDSAAFAYGRFVRLWDKADPALQDRVKEARDAIARLTAEPRR